MVKAKKVVLRNIAFSATTGEPEMHEVVNPGKAEKNLGRQVDKVRKVLNRIEQARAVPHEIMRLEVKI